LDRIDLKIPTLPGIAIELLEAVNRDQPDIKKASRIISTDAPLSAKVLRTINSPLYGLRTKISSVNQAMVMLGGNAVKNLALSFSLVSKFNSKKVPKYSYEQFWKDSLCGAVAARAISLRLKAESSEEAFFCGLLQNIGSLILVESFPEEYKLVVSEMQQHSGTTTNEYELKIIGNDHTRVGEYAIRKWGLPNFFQEAIRFHHERQLLEVSSSKQRLMNQIIYMSSLFIEAFKTADLNSAMAAICEYIDECGLSKLIDPTKIIQVVSDEVQSIFPIFEIRVDDRDLLRISESAKTCLDELSTNLLLKVRKQQHNIEQLRMDTITDGLTRIYNQRHFIKMLKYEMERAKRHGAALSLIIADIDEFKAINDFYGHLAGDYALKIIAARLKKAIRGTDYIFRYGGEEFAVILPGTFGTDALHIADRVREAIGSTPICYHGKAFKVTMSFGISSLNAIASIDLEGLIHMADEALYDAKDGGRNRCCLYDNSIFYQNKSLIHAVDDEDVV